jgi:hypothetical protein
MITTSTIASELYKTLKMATRIEESAAMTSKNIIEEEKRQTIFLLYTQQQMNCN